MKAIFDKIKLSYEIDPIIYDRCDRSVVKHGAIGPKSQPSVRLIGKSSRILLMVVAWDNRVSILFRDPRRRVAQKGVGVLPEPW